MTIKIKSFEGFEPSYESDKVASIETWWESAHREWAICLKNSEGTPIDYAYAKNKADRDEQVATLKEIYNI